MSAPTPAQRRFEWAAWFTLLYTLWVILWGAWVRISGSGDGCGTSWPTCHGELIPTEAETSTIIEFVHRVTSGMLVLIGIALIIWAFRAFGVGSRVRKATLWMMGFLIIECLIGAVLVIFALVGNDDSIQRAIVMAIHLVNTSLLSGAMLLIPWWVRNDAPSRMSVLSTGISRLLIAGVIVIMIINATGAVTAMGDTLYPIALDARTGLMERVEVAAFSTTNIVIQMRVLHPFIAIAGALFLLGMTAQVALRLRADGLVRRWAIVFAFFLLAQSAVGVVNILLGAPGWMQILHLAIAKLLWFAQVWFGMHALRHQQEAGHA